MVGTGAGSSAGWRWHLVPRGRQRCSPVLVEVEGVLHRGVPGKQARGQPVPLSGVQGSLSAWEEYWGGGFTCEGAPPPAQQVPGPLPHTCQQGAPHTVLPQVLGRGRDRKSPRLSKPSSPTAPAPSSPRAGARWGRADLDGLPGVSAHPHDAANSARPSGAPLPAAWTAAPWGVSGGHCHMLDSTWAQLPCPSSSQGMCCWDRVCAWPGRGGPRAPLTGDCVCSQGCPLRAARGAVGKTGSPGPWSLSSAVLDSSTWSRWFTADPEQTRSRKWPVQLTPGSATSSGHLHSWGRPRCWQDGHTVKTNIGAGAID